MTYWQPLAGPSTHIFSFQRDFDFMKCWILFFYSHRSWEHVRSWGQRGSKALWPMCCWIRRGHEERSWAPHKDSLMEGRVLQGNGSTKLTHPCCPRSWMISLGTLPWWLIFPLQQWPLWLEWQDGYKSFLAWTKEMNNDTSSHMERTG